MTKWIYIAIAAGLIAIAGTYFWLVHSNRNESQSDPSILDINDDLTSGPGRVIFKNLGPAPEFKTIDGWLNLPEGETAPKMEELKGQVVLVSFWTYSCNACINEIKEINRWNDTYRENGLAVIGVHTPQYAFEKVPENVQNAVDRFKPNYPVALDNSYAMWTAYKNQFWPAVYIVDKNGKIMYTHYGDGGLKTTEKALRLLLELETDPLSPITPASDPNKIKSPDIPLGLKHLDFFANETLPSDKEKRYRFPETVAVNTVALDGRWKLENEKAVLSQPNGKILLKFDAAKVYLKANSKDTMSLRITVDGKTQLPVTVEGANTYTLFESGDYGQHVLEIEVPSAGFEAIQFSFG